MFKRVFAAALGAALLAGGVARADDWTDIRYYAASKDIPHVAAMLDRGVSVEIRDQDGWTPLMIAAEQGDVAMVKFLLSRGANPNAANTRGRTAFDVTYSSDIKALLKPGYNAAPKVVPAPAATSAAPKPALAPVAKSGADKARSDFCQSQYRAAVQAFCSDDTCKMRENRKWSACLKSGRYN